MPILLIKDGEQNYVVNEENIPRNLRERQYNENYFVETLKRLASDLVKENDNIINFCRIIFAPLVAPDGPEITTRPEFRQFKTVLLKLNMENFLNNDTFKIILHSVVANQQDAISNLLTQIATIRGMLDRRNLLRDEQLEQLNHLISNILTLISDPHKRGQVDFQQIINNISVLHAKLEEKDKTLSENDSNYPYSPREEADESDRKHQEILDDFASISRAHLSTILEYTGRFLIARGSWQSRRGSDLQHLVARKDDGDEKNNYQALRRQAQSRANSRSQEPEAHLRNLVIAKSQTECGFVNLSNLKTYLTAEEYEEFQSRELREDDIISFLDGKISALQTPASRPGANV